MFPATDAPSHKGPWYRYFGRPRNLAVPQTVVFGRTSGWTVVQPPQRYGRPLSCLPRPPATDAPSHKGPWYRYFGRSCNLGVPQTVVFGWTSGWTVVQLRQRYGRPLSFLPLSSVFRPRGISSASPSASPVSVRRFLRATSFIRSAISASHAVNCDFPDCRAPFSGEWSLLPLC